jgi:hypothetical protein
MLDLSGAFELPPSPIADFNHLRNNLSDLLERAKDAHVRSEDAKIQQRLQHLEEIEMALSQASRQELTLSKYLEDFNQLGEFGAEGEKSVTEHIQELQAYICQLQELSDNEELVHAREIRQNQGKTLIEEMESILDRGDSEIDHEQVASDLLRLARAVNYDTATKLMERFEGELDFTTEIIGLRAGQRFWLDVAKSQPTENTESVTHARRRHRELQAELSRQESETQATTTVEELCNEIRNSLGGLSHLGREEAVVQINVWAGKLRRYQDAFEFSQDIDALIYYTFGAINSIRKELNVETYIEPLDRTISHDWNTFVTSWESKRDAARQIDSDRDEQRQKHQSQQQETELHRQQLAEQKAERAANDWDTLKRLIAENDPRQDPVAYEEFRELVSDLVENDGYRLDGFLECVVPFADMIAVGSEYRSLRRSLQKRDLWPDEISQFDPPCNSNHDKIQQELISAVKPKLAGKSLLIIGGNPREHVRETLTEIMDLNELQWPKAIDRNLDLSTFKESILGGCIDLVVILVRLTGHYANDIRNACQDAGIPWVMHDKGCGSMGIIRSIRDQASEAI